MVFVFDSKKNQTKYRNKKIIRNQYVHTNMQLFGDMKKKVHKTNKKNQLQNYLQMKPNGNKRGRKNKKKQILPPIASNGITFGSVDAPSEVRGCLNVFKRFILRRINYTNELNNKRDINL